LAPRAHVVSARPPAMPGPAVEAAARSGGDHHGGCCGKAAGKWEKTYLDVLGICCTAEVALVERLLTPIQGVRAVTVVVPSRTVIVDHDTAAVSQFHIGNEKKKLLRPPRPTYILR
jgi:Zn2+/Cd2+-exporting ATPase